MPVCGCSDIPHSFSSDDQGYEVRKNAHDRAGDKDKDQYAGDPLFKVGVLAEKVSGIEQETDQEDDPQDDGKDGPDGIRNVVHGILDSPDLGKGRCRCQ